MTGRDRLDEAEKARQDRLARIRAELDKGRAAVLAQRDQLCAHNVPYANCLECSAIAKETPDADRT